MSEYEDVTFDIEANNLLNEESIDYCSSPYTLKEDFAVHCIVVEEHSTGNIIAFYDGPTYELDGRRYEEEIEGYVYILENYAPVSYTHLQLNKFREYVEQKKIRKVIGHNIINFDLLVCKLYFGMDYEVSPDLWCGKEVVFEDTLVKSKTLNPDRFDGHSLDSLSAKTNIRKVDFRPNMRGDEKFKHFAADMLYYNIYDVKSNTAVDKYLEKEREGWNWDGPLELEKAVAEIITRQSHRGFWFNQELAQRNVEELDALMQERIQKIEPLLPPRPATKKFLAEHTPPVVQRTKKGEGPISAVMTKWVEKHGGKVLSDTQVEVFGKVYDLPIEREPLVTHMKATINDVTHIKGWLVEMGWSPMEYKERDLGTDTKKQKLPVEKFQEAVKRYVDQTLSSPFKEDRLAHLKTTESKLLNHLLGKQGKMCKVLTNPSLTVGQDKNICPNLEALSEKFPYAQDIVEYFTYRHRRNSILGGGAVWDEDDDDQEFEKGYMANVRKDGRIPTPADTCGAATSRFKHRVVCNVPRVSSLYGDKMRALFGVDKGFYQLGFDFDSLEARMEAHYAWKYDPTKEYCDSLLLEKPRDVHSRTAKKISEIIGRDFARQTAKNVKYGLIVGPYKTM